MAVEFVESASLSLSHLRGEVRTYESFLKEESSGFFFFGLVLLGHGRAGEPSEAFAEFGAVRLGRFKRSEFVVKLAFELEDFVLEVREDFAKTGVNSGRHLGCKMIARIWAGI